MEAALDPMLPLGRSSNVIAELTSKRNSASSPNSLL